MLTNNRAIRVRNGSGIASGHPSFLAIQVINSVSRTSCRVINIRDSRNHEFNKALAVAAAHAGWIVIAPLNKAPLERLLFGSGFELNETTIAELASQTSMIVINGFDRFKSQQAVLSACKSSSCQAIVVSNGEIEHQHFANAGITRYLCIELESDKMPICAREVIIAP